MSETKLNPQELATVLAALRVFQEALTGDRFRVSESEMRSMDHFADVEPLTDGQIDSLCERLNTEGLNA